MSAELTQAQRELVERWKLDPPKGYLGLGITPWLAPHVVHWVAECILQHAPAAQAVAFTGVSGALIAPAVALQLCLNPIAVRKGYDDSHGGSTKHPTALERAPVHQYVIVDDFVESGATLGRMLGSDTLAGMQCLGVFCYAASRATNRPAPYNVERRYGADAPKLFGCVPAALHAALIEADTAPRSLQQP